MATVTKIAPVAQDNHTTVHWLNDCIERGKRGVFSEVAVMNPGTAAEMLRRNPDNRGIRLTKVQQYAADMRNGKWTFNGEPIIVSDDGLVNDGQHRLTALIDANLTLPLLVVFGLPRDTRLTVDQGAARGAHDYLGMGNVENATTCSTIARAVIAFERGATKDIDTRLVTNAEVLERVAADPEIGRSAHYSVSTGRSARAYVAGSIIGICHYLFSRVSPLEAAMFLDGLCTGSDLKPGAPALACRERLVAMGKARNPKIAVIFRAWNMYRRGVKTVKSNGLISTLPLPALT